MPTRRQCANALRALAIDAIEQSRSGHPGAPLPVLVRRLPV